jgi:hypothetical protein
MHPVLISSLFITLCTEILTQCILNLVRKYTVNMPTNISIEMVYMLSVINILRLCEMFMLGLITLR